MGTVHQQTEDYSSTVRGIGHAIHGEEYKNLQHIAAGDGPFGYETHMHNRALRLANGVGVIILGFAIGAWMNLLPERTDADLTEVVHGLDRLVGLMTKDLVELPSTPRHPESFVIELLGVLIGVTVLKSVRQDGVDYQQTFNRIEPFYSAERRRRAWLEWSAYCIMGVLIGIGVPLLITLLPANVPAALTVGCSRFALAIGVWCVVYGTVLGRRTDLFRYNFRALRLENVYELGARESKHLRETRLGEKRLCNMGDAMTRVATYTGVLGALALYFLPTFRTPFFWVPLVIAVVITLLLQYAVTQYAKRRYEPDFDA